MVSFVKEVYSSFWQSGRGPKIGVAFAILPIGAFALAYATLGAIQVDYGPNDHQIAALSIQNTVASAIGCLAGGWLGDHFGTKKIVALAYALTAFMGMASMAISIGNYWQGIVAESMGYAVVLYLDALFDMLVILVIPFLREREERSAERLRAAESQVANP